MARLGRLCSEEGNCDALQGDNEHERWARLFGYVAVIDYNPIELILLQYSQVD